MMNFAIYQLPEGNANIRDLYFMTISEIEEISDQYEVVARITARSKDEAFRIGNFICEEDATKIEVVGEMRSISVGDIIHDLDTDETHVVGRIGFSQIMMKEAV